MGADVAEITLIPRAPRGREAVRAQISRLLHGHEIVLEESRSMARRAVAHGDDGSNDLIVGSVIRQNERHVWLIAEHLVDVPLTGAL
jgi:starvation-inducible DNA-binding protein